jgi:DNA-binding MarR family transcriptional regulator
VLPDDASAPEVAPEFAPDDGTRRTARQRRVEEVVGALRRMTTQYQKLGHNFALTHGLHQTDFEALVHVMEGEIQGEPLTPGLLAQALGLTSGATTSVIDRLEREGHIRRDRSDADRRRVRLHYGQVGAQVAREFFGPLGRRSDAVMAEFDDAELATVHRFMTAMTDVAAEYRGTFTRP